MSLWHWILYILTWLSADPVVFDREAARAAAAVSAARASMVVEAPQPKPPAPGPKPTPAKCEDCNGTGWITHGDGHRTKCPCGAAGCQDAKCRVSGASPATVSPARP